MSALPPKADIAECDWDVRYVPIADRKRRTLARLRHGGRIWVESLRYGESQAGAALLAGDGVVGLLKLLKQLGLVGCGDARASIADRHMERAIVRFSLDGNFAGIGELNRVADEIDQDLGQAAAVTVARAQLRSHFNF